MEETGKCSPPLEDAELSMIWQSACRFAEKVQSQEGYVAPDEYNCGFDAEISKPGDYSDIGQAKVLAREYGGEFRYTAATDYLRFCGQYWSESKQQALLDLDVSEDDITSGGKALEKKIGGSQMDAYMGYKAAWAFYDGVLRV